MRPVKDPSRSRSRTARSWVLQDWTAAYDAHPKFWFMVDLRSVTMVGAFTWCREWSKSQRFRDRSAVQVITTGIILTSGGAAGEGGDGVVPPTRPIVTGNA